MRTHNWSLWASSDLVELLLRLLKPRVCERCGAFPALYAELHVPATRTH